MQQQMQSSSSSSGVMARPMDAGAARREGGKRVRLGSPAGQRRSQRSHLDRVAQGGACTQAPQGGGEG